MPQLTSEDKLFLATNLSLKHGFITNVSSAVIILDPTYQRSDPKQYYTLGKFELTSRHEVLLDSITLHDIPYLRGPSVTMEQSSVNMTESKFNNRVASFSIEGSSCWTLYDLPNFMGRNATFRPGKYPSATQLGIFFKNIGSIEKLNNCPT